MKIPSLDGSSIEEIWANTKNVDRRALALLHNFVAKEWLANVDLIRGESDKNYVLQHTSIINKYFGLEALENYANYMWDNAGAHAVTTMQMFGHRCFDAGRSQEMAQAYEKSIDRAIATKQVRWALSGRFWWARHTKDWQLKEQLCIPLSRMGNTCSHAFRDKVLRSVRWLQCFGKSAEAEEAIRYAVDKYGYVRMPEEEVTKMRVSMLAQADNPARRCGCP